MGKLHTLGKAIVRVYANDHLPPHFHVVHPDFEALIVIETFTVYAGSLPPRVLRQVLEWASANRNDIVAEWNRTNPNFPA